MLNTTINGTSTICFPDSNFAKALYITKIIWNFCGLFCVMIGLPGHVFQGIIMLNRINRKQATSFYFVAIAVYEFFYLIGVLWMRLVSMSFIRFDPRLVFSCGFFYTMISGPTIASNLLLASLTTDRSLMILYPTRYRLLMTRHHVFKRISLVTLIVVLIMIPPYFSLSYDPNLHNYFLCKLRPSFRRWETNLWPLIHTILFAFVPSLMTCISSIILLRDRFRHRRVHKRTLSIRSRRMQTLSLLIALFSLISLVSILPVGIVEVIIFNDHIVNQKSSCSMRRIRYKILLNCFLSFMSMNYSLKFYVRLIISTPFRRDFLRLIGCDSGARQLNTRSSRHEKRLHSPSFLHQK
ncbi:unnamed protein product [Adineta steineri]|uniref:G-protein coupled receptors family 1 profile domain-containing protein n=1 Tax=Adineta steineri TaxID=433720 RepID=A0A813MXT2_9BILA|nr:unnamed protein product [Adineta steineri]CAF1329778.1 unnamed protein product [Adineta steineri]CAF3653252.1 unnamed protein product [Adineta steineri]CAF4065268.1 unnamed protein product [Adineta steineri]